MSEKKVVGSEFLLAKPAFVEWKWFLIAKILGMFIRFLHALLGGLVLQVPVFLQLVFVFLLDATLVRSVLFSRSFGCPVWVVFFSASGQLIPLQFHTQGQQLKEGFSFSYWGNVTAYRIRM